MERLQILVLGRNQCAFRAVNYMGHGGITVQMDMHAPTIEMYCRDVCVHCHQIANLHVNNKVCMVYPILCM